jgi:hypothetical protein
MKKNKLFIFISIITAILISGVAATCNFCGTPITVGEEETEEQKTAQQASSQTHQTTQQVQGEPAAPTIELNISEGPSYSEADDVCFYRIEATVTGSPAPKITWSKDDSGGTLGDNIAQVNLTRDDPRYTLVGTAKNSVDIATDDIVLTWGCDGEEGDGEEVAEEENNCPIISDFMISGFYMETYPCNFYNTYICDASDPDGDELTYNWDLSAGTIEEIENNVVVEGVERESAMSFYTPDTPGTITITVVVSDGICEVTRDATMEVVNE